MNEMEWNKQQNHEGGQQKQSTAQNRVVLLHPKKGTHAGCALDKSCFQVVCSMWKRQSPLSNRIRFSLSNDTRLTAIGSGSIHAPPREDTESSTASFLPAATARIVCSASIHAKQTQDGSTLHNQYLPSFLHLEKSYCDKGRAGSAIPHPIAFSNASLRDQKRWKVRS